MRNYLLNIDQHYEKHFNNLDPEDRFHQLKDRVVSPDQSILNLAQYLDRAKHDTSSWEILRLLADEANQIIRGILNVLIHSIENDERPKGFKYQHLMTILDTVDVLQGRGYDDKINKDLDKVFALNIETLKKTHITACFRVLK